MFECLKRWIFGWVSCQLFFFCQLAEACSSSRSRPTLREHPENEADTYSLPSGANRRAATAHLYYLFSRNNRRRNNGSMPWSVCTRHGHWTQNQVGVTTVHAHMTNHRWAPFKRS